MTVTAGEIKKLQESYADYGYESAEAFTEEAGGVEYLEWYILYNNTIDWLIEETVFLNQDGTEAVYPAPTAEPTAAPTAAPTK